MKFIIVLSVKLLVDGFFIDCVLLSIEQSKGQSKM